LGERKKEGPEGIPCNLKMSTSIDRRKGSSTSLSVDREGGNKKKRRRLTSPKQGKEKVCPWSLRKRNRCHPAPGPIPEIFRGEAFTSILLIGRKKRRNVAIQGGWRKVARDQKCREKGRFLFLIGKEEIFLSL